MTCKTKPLCLQCSLISAIMLFWLSGISQYNFADLDALLKQNQKSLNNFAVAVWKDGKIIYQKQTTDFTIKTQAPIGNSGNWLTAALVMNFVDEGKISLDDNVGKYIPIFRTYMKSYITIRNCITNTTGIHADAGIAKIFDKNKFASLEDEVTSYAKREIQTNPSTEFYYSNIGPDIAARVLEVVSKKSFDRLIMEKILRPLKMRNTSFSNEEGGAVNPSGGARSSASDYINFLSMLLNKGVFEGKQILSEKSVGEIETAQFIELPVKYVPKLTEGLHYGLGAWIEEIDSQGKPSFLSCNNLSGTYPYIDNCRNYAAIVLVEKPQQDPKREFYSKLKEAIGGQIISNCK